VNDLIILGSGGLQVLETYRVKHTGAQSIVTTSMNLLGELLRIFTTVEEASGDFNMLLNFGFCVTLSVIMFCQYFWYQKNTDSFYERQTKKSHDSTSDHTAASKHCSNDSTNNYALPPQSLTDTQTFESTVGLVEGGTPRRRKSGS
jgi:hypothetical protein